MNKILPSMFLVLTFSGLANAQAPIDSVQSRSLGYRSVSTIPDAELKDIYVSKIRNITLTPDQEISRSLVENSFQPLTSSLYLAYKDIKNPAIVVLWQENIHTWIKHDQLALHPYYRALYCTYLSKPYVKPGSANERFVNDMKDYLGCMPLSVDLRTRLPEYKDLITDDWAILLPTSNK